MSLNLDLLLYTGAGIGIINAHPEGDGILTEDGDYLVTEDGEYIIDEG